MELCKYSCGEIGNYQFKDGSWCCSDSHNKCPVNIKKNKKANSNRIVSEETRQKMRVSRIGMKDSEETRKRKSKARKGRKNPMYGKPHPNRKTADNLMKEHPFFCMIEEIRQNEKTKRIQVRCKLNTCRKWFTPTYDEIRYRIYALENPDGNDGLFFYCSDKCKNKCPSYNIKPIRSFHETDLPYTRHQYKIFREFVLERDNYICQFCGDPAVDVHHERPQKLEPFFALDPYFAWSCCQICHSIKGHPAGTECSNRKIGLRICNGR